ncbi:hypothetical protein [Ottowia sp.]|uniref:hypothetical protein n=1 Tax=Ottowia sp. TaxID=1898956 RepID=UPI0025DA8109|nr:hypothetical protein [Ottowia sp.]MBK6616515.1 hypothetical protein [Ottowia sp.]
MGSCKWLPRSGDICVCVGHSGDYFHDYVALRPSEGGLWVVAGEFSAYGFGAKLGVLEKKAFHLAQAGLAIELPALGGGDDVFWKSLADSFSKVLLRIAEIGRVPDDEMEKVHGARQHEEAGGWEQVARARAATLVTTMRGVKERDLKGIKGWGDELKQQVAEARGQAKVLVAESGEAVGVGA